MTAVPVVCALSFVYSVELLIEARDELEGAGAVAELQPAADRAGGRVARRLEAGAGEEARIHADVVLPDVSSETMFLLVT